MNLDDFIPLDELLEASLQSIDSTCSDRTSFQVLTTAKCQSLSACNSPCSAKTEKLNA